MKYLNDKQIIHIYRFYKRKKSSVDSSYISDQKKGAFLSCCLRHDEVRQSF